LRVVLIENLRRLAERVAANKAAREVANLCCDRIEDLRRRSWTAAGAALSQRGVGASGFLCQMSQRLQDRRLADGMSTLHAWLHEALPDPASRPGRSNTPTRRPTT
jgi:cyclic beta-1,2-glucan synthetase